ncbi:MAG: hypothetical protein ACREJ7_01235 [Candidatus Methylomirabilales bacterium]
MLGDVWGYGNAVLLLLASDEAGMTAGRALVVDGGHAPTRLW